MGHIPSRHVYMDLGDDAPEVVLLELESSTLSGWMWGDVYSLVIFIRRDDLAAGLRPIDLRDQQLTSRLRRVSHSSRRSAPRVVSVPTRDVPR